MATGDRQLAGDSTTLLVGAGLSIDPPSFVPAAARLGDLLVDWVCDPAPGLRPFLDELRQDPAVRTPYLGPYASLRFELLLQWLDFYAPQVVECLSLLDQLGYPNSWHYALAEAMHTGATVLTTNFDRRIEDACADLGVEVRRVVLSDTLPKAAAIREANLVKLHGSFDDRLDFTVRRRTRPVISLMQISRFGLGYERRPDLAAALRSHLDDRDLVVSGYSGWDSYDVVPLLEGAVPRSVRWHAFRAGGQLEVLAVEPCTRFWRATPQTTPADLALGQLAARAAEGAWTFRGSTLDALAAWLPPAMLARAVQLGELSAARADEAGFSADRAYAEVRDLLFDDDYSLDVNSARAIVEKLCVAYGLGWEPAAEDGISAELDAAVELEADSIAVTTELERRLAEGEEAEDEHERRARELAESHRYLDLGKYMLQQVDEAEGWGTPLYAEVALWAVHDAYQRALDAEKLHQAWCLARLFRKTALRRRSLWGEVYASYLEAVTHHRSSLSRPVRAGRRARSTAWHRNRCYELLEHVESFAFRVPRLDLLREAALLRAATAPDATAREREDAILSSLPAVWDPGEGAPTPTRGGPAVSPP